MRIYIAGPMTGHEDLNEPAFRAAPDMLRREGPAPTIPHDITPREHDGPCPTTYAAAEAEHDAACYLRADLAWMVTHAEAVYFLPGWQHSRGARHERCVAEACGIPIRFDAQSIPGVAS